MYEAKSTEKLMQYQCFTLLAVTVYHKMSVKYMDASFQSTAESDKIELTQRQIKRSSCFIQKQK